MKLTIIFIVTMVVFMPGIVMAQNVNDGLSKINQKEYGAARQIFDALLKADPKNAVALYGMGEYYFHTGKKDSAKLFYQNGLDANSSYPYNYAGLGKVSYASDKVIAEGYFKDVIKKSKKDIGPLVSIAKFFYEQKPKDFTEAKRYIDMAITLDGKNGPAYFLDGLIDLDQSNVSEAALNFDRSIFFDPNNLEAYLYASQIMASTRNLHQAAEYLNKAIAINSNYWTAYKTLGELYYDNQKYLDAITNFDIYFKNISPPDNDLTHYAYSLFFNKQFQVAREMIDKLIVKNPNDYILLRLVGYISYETKDLVNGKSIMEQFFKLVPTDKILTDDYSYYGKMLSASGNDSLAIENYKLALKMDSSQYQIFDEIAKSFNKLKQFELGLQYSSRYYKMKPNLTPADYFLLGKAYYSTANSLNVKTDTLEQNIDPTKQETDSLKQLELYNIADSLFTKVEDLSPNSYLGTFWRARVNSMIDKETTLGLAKPYYEKALKILNNDHIKYKKEISEIYAYLGFYYYVKEDTATSIEHWKKLLEVDSGNMKAQEAIKSLEKK